MPSPSLTPDWREWIQINLNRNCTVASMVDAMVAQAFEPASAAAAIALVAAGEGGNSAPKPASAPPKRGTDFEYENSRIPAVPEICTSDRVVPIQMRMQRPEVVLFRGVLSHEECEELIARAREKVTRSTTIDRATGEAQIIPNRSSFGTFFHLEEDDFIAKLDRRLADLTHWPLDNSEGIQILNYRVGGEYKPHFDFFPPDDSGSTKHLSEGGQRIASVVMYLNDVEEGGETIFPELTLSIAPHAGDAVYFGYCNARNQVDRLTLHGGAPVIRGEKWIATKWLRQHRRR